MKKRSDLVATGMNGSVVHYKVYFQWKFKDKNSKQKLSIRSFRMKYREEFESATEGIVFLSSGLRT